MDQTFKRLDCLGSRQSIRLASVTSAPIPRRRSAFAISTQIGGRNEDELAASLTRLEEYERAVSRNRRRVQEAMDSCTAEVARRYQSGEATVDDLLADR